MKGCWCLVGPSPCSSTTAPLDTPSPFWLRKKGVDTMDPLFPPFYSHSFPSNQPTPTHFFFFFNPVLTILQCPSPNLLFWYSCLLFLIFAISFFWQHCWFCSPGAAPGLATPGPPKDPWCSHPGTHPNWPLLTALSIGFLVSHIVI